MPDRSEGIQQDFDSPRPNTTSPSHPSLLVIFLTIALLLLAISLPLSSLRILFLASLTAIWKVTMPKSRSQPTLPLPTTSPIPSTFTDSLPLPSIIVFDLDYTLWPFWVDTHVSGPVKLSSPAGHFNTRMLDRWGESFGFYTEVPTILAAAKENGVTMSLASRTHAPDLAREMLRGLHVPNGTDADAHATTGSGSGISQQEKRQNKRQDETTPGGPTKLTKAIELFVHPQIYPGSKTRHFRKLQAQLQKTPPTTTGGGAGGGSTVPFDEMLFFDDEGRNRNVETELGVTFWLVPDGVNRDEFDRGVWEWRKRRGISKKDLRSAGTGAGGAGDDGAAELEG